MCEEGEIITLPRESPGSFPCGFVPHEPHVKMELLSGLKIYSNLNWWPAAHYVMLLVRDVQPRTTFPSTTCFLMWSCYYSLWMKWEWQWFVLLMERVCVLLLFACHLPVCPQIRFLIVSLICSFCRGLVPANCNSPDFLPWLWLDSASLGTGRTL